MAKATKAQRQAATNKNQMNLTWESYEHLLRDDLERMDTRMYKMNQEARGFGVEQEYITAFVTEKMTQLIAETVESREQYVKTHRGMKLY